jgi:D-aminopeptidase
MRARPRDLGLVLGTLPPGARNTIADVGEVRVGHATLVEGDGPLVPGKGPVRTGVTVVVPHRGNVWRDRPKAAWDTINGAGELAGSLEVREYGVLSGPIGLTTTNCVGNVATGLVEAILEENPDADAVLPVVSECDDSDLNDARGLHVKPAHARDALRAASPGFDHGTVGAGTGMTCFDYKGGIGSASRALAAQDGGFRVGALVVSNFGWKQYLTIAGVPVGRELLRLEDARPPRESPRSIVMVLATDAPLSSRQLGRLARRAFHGLARTGSFSGNTSGDIAIAFSTAQWVPRDPPEEPLRETRLADERIDPLLIAAVEATEEAIVDSLFAATTVVGRDGHTVHELPLAATIDILDRYGRIA